MTRPTDPAMDRLAPDVDRQLRPVTPVRASSLDGARTHTGDGSSANRRLALFAGLVVAAAIAVLYWLAEYVHPFGLTAWMVKESALRVFVWSVRDLFRSVILTPGFAAAMAFTLMLERLIPAKPNQPVFSINFAQDLVWFFYETILSAAIIVTY